jgi:SMI1-KNR4 cell-wall
MWKDLADRLELQLSPGLAFVRPPAKDIEGGLSACERELGLALPASYRAFVHQFGPGDLSGFFRIYAPPYRGARGRALRFWDITRENEAVREPDRWWAGEADPALLTRLVLFGSTGGGDWFFWDTADMRDARAHEYGVYAHQHGDQAGEVEPVAGSFERFVREVCLGRGYPSSDDEWHPLLAFSPAWQARAKKAKPKAPPR